MITDGTIGLYLGWVCVATAANITAYLVAIGFRGPRDVWAVAIIAVAGIVGVLMAIRGRGRIAPTLSLCWGLAWVANARLDGPLISIPTAVAAIAAVVVVVATTIVTRRRA
ncbi:MAG: rane protein [Frondihabitans sp.]|nr:rane protein [Frondihabitans sp.]